MPTESYKLKPRSQYYKAHLGEGTPELKPELNCDAGWWVGVSTGDSQELVETKLPLPVMLMFEDDFLRALSTEGAVML